MLCALHPTPPSQAPPSNGADDARQVPFCCPKLGTQPIFNSPARVVPLVPAIDLSSVVAFPARPLFVLPVGSAATTARSDGGQMVEGGIHYVISRKHDQCVVARPNVWKGEELCDCKSDGCKTCDERLSTVAQKEDDSALSSVADSVCTERGSPSMSVEDDNSVRSEKGKIMIVQAQYRNLDLSCMTSPTQSTALNVLPPTSLNLWLCSAKSDCIHESKNQV